MTFKMAPAVKKKDDETASVTKASKGPFASPNPILLVKNITAIDHSSKASKVQTRNLTRDRKGRNTRPAEEVVGPQVPDAQFDQLQRNDKQSSKYVPRAKTKTSIHQCDKCSFHSDNANCLVLHHQRVHQVKKLTCLDCGRQIFRLVNIREHMRSHMKPPHRCDKCGKEYRSKVCYLSHLESHQTNYVKPQFPCHICGKYYSTRYVLDCHLRAEHSDSGQKTFSCSTCGKHFTEKESFLFHVESHKEERPFGCDICGDRFVSLLVLRTHEMTHSGEMKYVCPICNVRFNCASKLTTHKYYKHKVEMCTCMNCGKTLRDRTSLRRHMRTHTGIRPFECLLCGQKATDSSILRRHMLNIHGKNKDNWKDEVKYHLPVTKFKVSTEQQQLEKKKSEDFVCSVCGKRFRKKDYLQRHEVSHLTENLAPLVKKKASVTLVTRASQGPSFASPKPILLVKNITAIDHNSKAGKVQTGNLTRNRKGRNARQKVADSFTSTLRRRMLNVRGKNSDNWKDKVKRKFEKVGKEQLEKKESEDFVCSVCGKHFPRRDYLWRHKLSHLTGMPFQCDVCDRRFKLAIYLRRHKDRMHSRSTAPKQKSTTRNNKKQHLCLVCNKSFCRLSRLQNHIQCHKTTRDHVCRVCGKAYKRDKDLKVHLGQLALQCLVCGEKCLQPSSMKAHVMDIHGMNKHNWRELTKSYLLEPTQCAQTIYLLQEQLQSSGVVPEATKPVEVVTAVPLTAGSLEVPTSTTPAESSSSVSQTVPPICTIDSQSGSNYSIEVTVLIKQEKTGGNAVFFLPSLGVGKKGDDVYFVMN